MSEPIIEQIADWINDTLDGKSDPAGTLTMRSVRPTILDWEASDFAHGNVIIELGPVVTVSRTTVESRTEKAIFKLYGIIRTLPEDTKADTILARMAETIRRTMLAGNANGQAMSGLALKIDCPNFDPGIFDGGILAEITAEVLYQTTLKDGYTAP